MVAAHRVRGVDAADRLREGLRVVGYITFEAAHELGLREGSEVIAIVEASRSDPRER
jgi:molybdopterin-binding protein